MDAKTILVVVMCIIMVIAFLYVNIHIPKLLDKFYAEQAAARNQKKKQ